MWCLASSLLIICMGYGGCRKCVAVTHSFHHLCVVTILLTLVVFIIPNMRSNESIDRCCVPIYVLLLRQMEEPYTPEVGIS